MSNINSVKNYKYSILVKKIGALKSLKKKHIYIYKHFGIYTYYRKAMTLFCYACLLWHMFVTCYDC